MIIQKCVIFCILCIELVSELKLDLKYSLFVLLRCGVIVFESSQDFQKFVHFNGEAPKVTTKVYQHDTFTFAIAHV